MSVWVIKVILGVSRWFMGAFGLSYSHYDNKVPLVGFDFGLDWWSSKEKKKPKNPNPNPYRFKILEWMQTGPYLAVKINYPDCTNYEGNKILVYDGIDIDDLKKYDCIDPHFSGNEKFKSPIARFEPTEQGWIYALKFCSYLHGERVELSY